MPTPAGIMLDENGDGNFRFYPGAAASIGMSGAVQGAVSTMPESIAGLVLEVAPAVTSNPTVTGSTTVGSILGGTNGTATGNPTPTPSIAWERNGAIVPGQNGSTLPTTGFAVGDQIVRIVTWSAIIDGQTVTAEARSAPLILTEQPTLQILDITTPLVAGQPASVTFNSAPETVTGNVTFAGTGATRTFTAPSGTLTIGATLAGYTSFSQTYPVQPAPAALAVTADNTAQITGLTASASVQIGTPDDATDTLDGTYTVDPADGTNGPEWIAGPWLTRDGTTLRLQRGAIVVDGATLSAVTHAWPDGTTGPTWTHRPQDAGTTVSVTLNAVDSLGREGTATVGVAIPAVPSATPDTFAVAAANIDGTTTESGETWTRTTTSGQVEATGGRLVTRSNAAYVRGALNRGGNQYVECDFIVGTSFHGVFPAVRVQADPTTPDRRRGLAAVTHSLTTIMMRHYNAVGGTNDLAAGWNMPADGSWDAGTTHRIGLGITEAGAATLYADGVAVRTATFTDLSNGGAGVISNGSAGTSGMAVDNIIIRAAR